MTNATSSVSVLCIDNEPGMADIVGTHLERFGADMTATAVTGPQAALEMFDPEDYDCIVSDYHLSQMDGIELLATIRAEYPDFPFILFTGRGSEKVAGDAISTGVTDYVQKESGTDHYEVLATRVHNAVKSYRLREPAANTKKRAKTILEASPSAVLVSIDNSIQYLNPAALDLVAPQSETAVFDTPISSVLHSTERVDNIFEAVENGEAKIERDQFTLKTPDGEIQINCSARPISWDENPAVVYVFEHIPDQINRQSQLEKTNELFDHTERIADVGGWEIDTDTRDVFLSDNLYDILGVDSDVELSLEEALDIYHEEDRAAVEDAVETALDNGDSFDLEVRFERSDGEAGWLRIQGVPTVKNGEAVTLRGAVQDITEDRRMESELRQERDRIEGIIETSPVGIIAVDSDGDIDFSNKQAERITGRSSEAISGIAYDDSRWGLTDEDGESLEDGDRPFERVTSGKESIQDRVLGILRPSGDRVWVSVNGSCQCDDNGEVQRTIFTLEEITEQRELQSRLEEVLGRVTDAFFALDDDFRFTHVNSRAEELLQASEEELLGKSLWEQYSEAADIEEVWDAYHTAVETQDPQQFELYYDPLDFYVEAMVYPSETGASVYFRDITDRKERERQLASFQSAIEQGADGVAILDDEEYVYVDDTHVEMYGFDDKDQLLGETWQKLYDNSEIDRLETEAFPALEADGHWRGSVTGHRSDGTPFPTEISLTLIDDGRIVCTARDEAEQYRQKRELELFQQAIEQAADGVAVLEDGEYTYIDKTHVEMYGFESKAQLLGDTWQKLYDDAEAERLETEVFPALEADGQWRGPVTGTRPDGTTFPAELSLTIIKDGRLVCTVRDETERKERERELKLKEQAMDEATVGIQIADATKDDNPLIYVNNGFEQMTGYTSEEVLGRNPRLLQGDDTDPEQRAELREAIEQDVPVSLDIQNYRKDGTPYWSRLSITPVTNEQGTVGKYIGIQQDVTERREREQKLLAERERFRLLIESVDEYAFLAVDEDGQIQTWNSSAETLFGYTDETAIGMPVAALHPPADRESKLPERLLQQAKLAGKSAHEGWQVTADGDRFYADTRYVGLENAEGSSRGYAKIVRDMTKQRQQRRRTERFVEESDDAIAIADTDGEITYLSGSAPDVLAYETDEIIGENLFDYIHETDRKEVMQTFFATMENANSDQQIECRLKSGNDNWLNVEVQCRNMLDDDAINGMLLYFRDVTDSKRRARRFESIFNQTFQFAGLLKPDGTVIEVNDNEVILSNSQNEGIVGELFHETSLWTHSETVQDKVEKAIDRAKDGEAVRYETEMQDVSGLATVDFSVKPVIDEEGDVSVLVVEGRDITDQQRQSQHLDVIHRVMRHNMRNDLSKLRGWAEQMSEEPDPDVRAEHFETLKRIFDKWESMTERVKQIRQASQRADETTGLDPHSLVEDAVAPVSKQYPTATISTEVPVDESTRVPTTLLDAVRELVENAAKAETDATVSIDVVRLNDSWVEVSVCDDGPGLPEMEAKALETGVESDLNHGDGLGLWMVRMITMQAGGDISVNVTGAGTEVRLQIPTQ